MLSEIENRIERLEKFIERRLEIAKLPRLSDDQYDDPEIWDAQDAQENFREIKAALERVRADEREACARVCEELVIANAGRADLTADQCAAAIRARKEKE